MGLPELPLATRRAVLRGAVASAGAVALAGRGFDREAAAAPSRRGAFGYGVASGDPLADRVVIWTRATPATRPGRPAATPGSGLGGPLAVQWEVATDRRMLDVVRRGRVRTSRDSDHTVKVDVTGLEPYTRYFYRFTARGEQSPVGVTRTAPDVAGETHALRMALVSCSNYTGGWFTAYRAIADRTDLDLVLHVGDYLYEYGNGEDRYGPDELVGVRDHQPATEIVSLHDYRLRHALHKADPDLREAHRVHPWITIFDDHEVTNDAWSDGAENHDAGEGSFYDRRAAAFQAYLEWMPFRLPDQSVPHQGIRFFRRFTYGDLAELSVLDTRQNRSQQVGGFLAEADPATTAALDDPSRVLPEPEQMAWIKDGLAATTAPWHLLAQQTVMTRVRFPGAALGAPAGVELLNADQWDGYRHDQRELIGHARGQATDTVVLTGDIHSSWAAELVADPGEAPGGTEFVCPSVTSDGIYELVRASTGLPPEGAVGAARGVTAGVQGLSPWVRYLDGVGHGFAVVDVTPERVQVDFHLTPVPTTARPDPRTDRTALPTFAASYLTLAGTRAVVPAAGPLGPRADEPGRRRDREPGAMGRGAT